jgi:hypothetical protein
MTRWLSLAASIAIGLLLLTGCSQTRVFHDISDIEIHSVDLINRHADIARYETTAQLAQMTIRSPKLTKRFNVEIYHRNDSTAFFSGGFVGKGSFKGIMYGSMLQFLLMGEKQFYDGPMSGLIRPDLGRYGYVVARLRSILAGRLLCRSDDAPAEDLCTMWEEELHVKKNKVRKLVFRSVPDPIRIEVNLYRFKDKFPFYQIKEIKLVNDDNGATIKLKFIEQRCGPVPDIKFSMPDVSGWERIEYFELD